jgi:hypothetical protein
MNAAESAADEPFWLVADLHDAAPISSLPRFETYALARAEAERLARQHRGRRIYVLGTSMFAETGDLRVVEFKRIEELPL